MFHPNHNQFAADPVIARAMRMFIQHDARIPAVRPTAPASVGARRIIMTSMVRNVAPQASA